MANEKRLIDANALWLTFSEKAEKIEIGVKDKVNKSLSKIVLHWCMDKLATAPRVDAVEVVHGKWIEDRWTKWQCDKCHSPSPAYGYPRMEYVKTRYCPNCGAKMDGERKDNEISID